MEFPRYISLQLSSAGIKKAGPISAGERAIGMTG